MAERDDGSVCADCGTTKGVDLFNSREVRYGFLWLKVKTPLFPGFLCTPCWRKANPTLFPLKVGNTWVSQQRESMSELTKAYVQILVVILLIVGILGFAFYKAVKRENTFKQQCTKVGANMLLMRGKTLCLSTDGRIIGYQ